ncbi:hypothetical protein BDN71DRAFT_334294 [Pleurotus eryngii]|uniref:Uncharacterized protein n=1 Tax=Pleurotus eryngii TaxID=5323 RepID=A0A9P6DA29_PLEER|nr:hypothetical protein BDN71DRAFT_334294 [Pleurotus eryngii]
MSTRHHVDSRLANPTVVPRFPRPFDGKHAGPPPVLTVNPASTIGSANRLDDTIVVDDIPRARDKVVCECGGEVTRSYLEKHRLTPKHLALVAEQRKAGAKPRSPTQKKGDGAPKGLAHASASGKHSAHEQNGANSDAHEYTVPLHPAYFDANNDILMTNPYHRADAFIYR